MIFQSSFQRLRARAAAFLVAALCVGPIAHAAVTAEQQALVDQVMGRLLNVIPRPDMYDAWPPAYQILDDDEIGAYSWIDFSQLPKKMPIIRIHRGFLETIAEMNEHRAAFVLGHELAHLCRGHSLRAQGDTPVAVSAYEREDEIEADKLGMEFALRAGYSFRPALGAARRFIDIDGDYTSFEGVGVDHPSWADRIALLETDEAQADLWRSMSAFSTGVYFLETEQHQHAAECFERVVREFPKCYEAWANLGYARLMMYCDGLELEDLRNFDVGHLIVGGFYQRAGSLAAALRGINEELWQKAVEALQTALTLKEDLILAKANLAVAQLVHPRGTPDVGAAAKLFDEVSQLLANESIAAELDPLTRASLLANAWIGVAHSDPAQSAAVMQQIELFLQSAEQDARASGGAQSLRSALGFTQASALAAATSEGDRRRAIPLFEQYLASTSPTSAWWPLAYERYVAAAQTLNAPAKTREELAKRRQNQWRVVSSVTLRDGASLGVSDPAPQALERLGPADATAPVADGDALTLLDFRQQGLSVLMGREVLAIVLNQPDSPRIALRRPGLGTLPSEIYVGMPKSELQALLGDEWISKQAPVVTGLVAYQVYHDVGVAVRFADQKVVEIVIAQPPREYVEK